MNYLNSLEPNAIIFTNGDNDTFPLWYAQEVEGVRTDVKVVNQSYLTTPWYVNMMREPSYQASGIGMKANPTDYAYDKLQWAYFSEQPDTTVVDALTMLGNLYSPRSRQNSWNVSMIDNPLVFIPVDIDNAVKKGRLSAAEASMTNGGIITNLANGQSRDGMTLGNIISLDMIATSMANGWNRPVYFAMTVPDEYYLGMAPFMRQTGIAYEITPLYHNDYEEYGRIAVDTDRTYRNITERWRWGGLDTARPGSLYLDETVRRMVTSTRLSMLNLAEALVHEGMDADDAVAREAEGSAEAVKAQSLANDRYTKARHILDMMEQKLPAKASPYVVQDPQTMALLYDQIGRATGNKADTDKAIKILHDEIMRYGRYLVYYQSLSPSQYATLQPTDRYIDRSYVVTLLRCYQEIGGDINGAALELERMGVDINRMMANASAANAN